jgi:hypothetical protein
MDAKELEEIDTENSKDQGVPLNLDALNKQKKTTTSMSDIYGYSVFSIKFDEQLKRNQELEKRQQEMYLLHVLEGEKEDTVEKSFEAVFYSEVPVVVKADSAEKNIEKESLVFIVLYILIGILFAGGIIRIIDTVRKGKKANEDTNYNSGLHE